MMWLRLAGVVALLAWPAFADQTLPSFHVAATQTSVSGLSSGAFMAVQFHTAYSARVMGVGVVAGGPYDCVFAHYPGLVDPVTNPFVVTAGIDICMNANPAPPDGAESWRKAQHFADIEDIDTTGHLAQSRVYVFSGSKDKTVVPSVAAAAYAYYRAAGVPPANIQYVHDIPAGHAFISPAAQQDCDKTGSPYINRCVVDGRPYDQAGAILTQIYGPLNAPSLELGGRKITFDQARYGDAMGPTGFLYVPRSCNEGATCRIHVVFHGCEQTPADIGDQFYAQAGYNQWADTNNILVLYPQAPSDDASNPQHCWDLFGYTGPDFDKKVGPQMSAVSKMLDRLAGQ